MSRKYSCEDSMRGWGPTGYVDPATGRETVRRPLETWRSIAHGGGAGWTKFERMAIAELLKSVRGRRWLMETEL